MTTGGSGEGGGDDGGGGDENRVFIKVPSPVTRCEAPRFRSCHDADLAHAGTDLTAEYAARDGLGDRSLAAVMVVAVSVNRDMNKNKAAEDEQAPYFVLLLLGPSAHT